MLQSTSVCQAVLKPPKRLSFGSPKFLMGTRRNRLPCRAAHQEHKRGDAEKNVRDQAEIIDKQQHGGLP
jgi:hypothetical protein